MSINIFGHIEYADAIAFLVNYQVVVSYCIASSR
jgi:hypothetical protein